MPTFNGSISVNLEGELINAVDVGEVGYPINYGPNFVFTNGTGANQANEAFTDTRTLSASASENLDLAGVLVDVFGNTLTFTKVKALIIKADASNTNDVVVGGHATAAIVSFFNASTDKVKVKPGGALCLIAPDANGYAITATTADMLTIANGSSGSSVTYTIIIIGVA